MSTTITTQQAAKHFKVSTRTIHRWIRNGKLKAEQVEGRWSVFLDRHDGNNGECDVKDDAYHVNTDEHDVDDNEHGVNDGGCRVEADERDVSHDSQKIAHLTRQLEQGDFERQHLSKRLEEKNSDIQQLYEMLARRDEQIESLMQQHHHTQQSLDQAQQLLAVQTKTNAALTDRLQAIEDMRNRPWWQRLFSRGLRQIPG